MPASERFQPIKHKMKGKGFQVLNKCPYCKEFHATIEDTPLAPWLHHNHFAELAGKIDYKLSMSGKEKNHAHKG